MKNLIEKEKTVRRSLKVRSGSSKSQTKGMALFEIILMVTSIVAIAYFIGDEFQIVSAKGITAPITVTSGPQSSTVTTAAGSATVNNAGPLLPSAPIPAGDVGGTQASIPDWMTWMEEPATPAASGTPLTGIENPSLYPSGVTSGPGTVTTELTGGGASWDSFFGAVKSQGIQMLVNAAIAIGLYYAIAYGISAICPTCDAEALKQMAPWVAGGYAIASLGANIVDIILGTLSQSAIFGPWSMLIGAGGAIVGALIWWLFIGKQYTEIVAFTCQPWQPQTGGSNCEKCNNRDLPCSEYKCRSLGVNCQLLNSGTDKELCAAININDFTPPTITAWQDALQDNFTYAPLPEDVQFPTDKGVYVNYQGSSDNCAPPFTKITFGVSLNEPGQCRVDIVRKDKYDDMTIKLSVNQYRYNHGILVVDPSKQALEAADLTQSNGGNYELYVRCQDGHEPPNKNVATFVFKYCIQQQEDITAPKIEMTTPINGWPIQNHQTSQDIQIYVDKPATCKWDHNDVDYDKMGGTMTCDSNVKEVNANMLYECDTTLTGLKDSVENRFYIRCNSYNGHKNPTSYVYKLIGTRALVIDWLKPDNSTVLKDSAASVKVTLQAHTSAGYDNGIAKCWFKQKSEDDSRYESGKFFNTNSYESSQELWFTKGSYKYSIKCCDVGGNCQTGDVSFTVDTDFQSPIVVRAYNEANSLKIETNEEAECVYDTTSCSYNFDDGLKFTTSDNINHFIDWNPNTNLYIKCKDGFGNQPLPNQCSITIRPFNSY